MRVHPAADIFPMVSDDALASLAESIKANGLRFPIVVREVQDEDGAIEQELIDGRNRLAACKTAGVEPTFIVFEGDEDAVLAFIADVNLQRRDLKKTQKAALYARMYPEPKRLKRKAEINSIKINEINGIKNTEIDGINFVHPAQLTKCRAVYHYSPALLTEIINDRLPLETAFAEAKEAEARSKGKEAQLARLRSESPDLADRVEDETMTLAGALAENEERMREKERLIRAAREASLGFWHDISARLGAIARGQELGEQYAIPDGERDLAENVMRLLTTLLERTS